MDKESLIPQNPNRKCVKCGYLNLHDALVCSNCLQELSDDVSSSRVTRELPELLEEAHRRTRLQPLGKQLQERMDALSTSKDQRMPYQAGMKVILQLQPELSKVVILPNQLMSPYTLGRRDSMNGKSPSLDLDGYGGYRKGVSRTHATFNLNPNGLFIIDLGSANGTFINGRRIPTQTPHPLYHEDKLELGQLVCVVTFSF